MSEVVFFQESVIVISPQLIEELKQSARQAPLKRARLCLHKDHEDQVQQMIIALCQDTDVRPHRHPNKSESFHVLEGEIRIRLFDDTGGMLRDIDLAGPGSGLPSIYRMNVPHWHTTIPLTDIVVVHEIVAGPFNEKSSEFPVWA